MKSMLVEITVRFEGVRSLLAGLRCLLDFPNLTGPNYNEMKIRRLYDEYQRIDYCPLPAPRIRI